MLIALLVVSALAFSALAIAVFALIVCREVQVNLRALGLGFFLHGSK
ncbi:MAG: hypothetical protein ABSC13_08445 [Dehalococcoidia bacterium]|jgi:hypothetical protein